jgi:hypothetical protein
MCHNKQKNPHLLAAGGVKAQLLEDGRHVLARDELGGLHDVLGETVAALESFEPASEMGVCTARENPLRLEMLPGSVLR